MTHPPPASIPVSVVIPTRDEAANIAACLAPLRPFAQVIVADSASTDGTAAIAGGWGALVLAYRWNGRHPKKKQWCLAHPLVAHDWVLLLDADEILTPALVAEIAALIRAGPAKAGYFIDGRPVFAGKALRFGTRNRKLCLLDRRRAAFPPGQDDGLPGVWEVEGHYQPRLDGPAGRLRAPLLHRDAKPPAAWFDRHNRYSDWVAALEQAGRDDAWAADDTPLRRALKRLFRAAAPARPALAFLQSYVWKRGCLDGAPGFHYAVARAVYYWQIGLKRRVLTAAAAAGVAQPVVEAGKGGAHRQGPALQQADGLAFQPGLAEQVAADAGLFGPAAPGFADGQPARFDAADGQRQPPDHPGPLQRRQGEGIVGGDAVAQIVGQPAQQLPAVEDRRVMADHAVP